MTVRLPHVEEFQCAIVGQSVTLRWTELNWRESDGRVFSARTRSSCDGSPGCGRLLCGVSCPFRWRSGDDEWALERRRSPNQIPASLAGAARLAASRRRSDAQPQSL